MLQRRLGLLLSVPRGRVPVVGVGQLGRLQRHLRPRLQVELQTKVPEDFTIMEKAPSRGLLRDYEPSYGPSFEALAPGPGGGG